MDLDSWQERRFENGSGLAPLGIALTVAGTMLAVLTIATAAVLVAGRMANQIRQVGTLKAVGFTPGQVTGVVLLEHLALAGIAGIIGITAGTLLSPLLARTVIILYGAPQVPPLTWTRAGIVAVVATAVVVLATVRPALRGVRHSTLRSLIPAVRQPKRASRLARFAAALGLPVPAILGLRGAARRPGRTLANATSLALGVAMVVIGLALEKSIRDFRLDARQERLDPAARAITDALVGQVRTVVFVAAGLLLVLGTVNAVVTAVFAARDSARTHAILRSVGATPRQSVTAFVVAQLGTGLLATAVGIPLGVFIFNGNAQGLAPARLSGLTYVAVALAAPTLYAAIVAAPARLLARQPVAAALTYE